jgi:hypothetical protein
LTGCTRASGHGSAGPAIPCQPDSSPPKPRRWTGCWKASRNLMPLSVATLPRSREVVLRSTRPVKKGPSRRAQTAQPSVVGQLGRLRIHPGDHLQVQAINTHGGCWSRPDRRRGRVGRSRPDPAKQGRSPCGIAVKESDAQVFEAHQRQGRTPDRRTHPAEARDVSRSRRSGRRPRLILGLASIALPAASIRATAVRGRDQLVRAVLHWFTLPAQSNPLRHGCRGRRGGGRPSRPLWPTTQ